MSTRHARRTRISGTLLNNEVETSSAKNFESDAIHRQTQVTNAASAIAALLLSAARTSAPGLLSRARSRFEPHQAIANKCMDFLDASPEAFHATHCAANRLEAAGFQRLDEKEPWIGVLKPGGKYYYTRNRSCLVAFVVGAQFAAGNGFKIIGAHQDSPNLRLKPRSKLSNSGCLQLDVECYGGGLWHTWFDRDLSLSGRVFVKKGNRIEQQLVDLKRPVLRVPNLCIHLQSQEERQAFKINKEDHLQPILAVETKKVLEAKSDGEDGEETAEDAWAKSQETLLLQLLAEALDIPVSDIVDFECFLYDTQKASISGASQEFLCSARLDNLASCFVATQALIEHAADKDNLAKDVDVSLVALFDHEEVGSDSTVGAGSPIMGEAVRRITTALGGSFSDALTDTATQRSFVVSADMAHAVHPNYKSKHESMHGPLMNEGIVIKSNQNQRYASNGVTSLIVREIARRNGLPVPQEFVVRNDCPCGSTIGPIISANTGIRAVDIGMPQLSMHSIREMMGVADLTNCLEFFRAFYKDFRAVDDMLEQ